jgi:putative drug exporter of the RND superfamily
VPQHEGSKPSLFARIGYRVGRSRSLVIGLWILLMVASLSLTPQLERSLKGAGMTYEAGEARRTEQLLQQDLNFPADPLTVVFQASTAENLKQAQPAVDRLLSQIRQIPEVGSATDARQHQSPDRRTQYSLIRLKQNGSDTVSPISPIRQVLNQGLSSTLKTFLTGKAAVDQDVLGVSKADLARAELIALPLTLIALLFVFGSLVAATLPIAMGVLTVSVTFGLLYFIAQHTQMSVLALNFTTMLGLGLGIDYSLLMVNRFREELHCGSVSQAVTRTVETAGRAVFVSGMTVCISLFCLLLFPISVLRSIGIAGSLVVLLSVAAALTLLPALLALIGHRIDGGRRIVQSSASSGFWTAVARQVTRRSVASIAIVLAIVAFLSFPFLNVHFGLGDASILPRSVSSRQGVEQIQQSFGPGEISPILLTVQTSTSTDNILSPQHLAILYPLVARLQKDPRVASVSSLLNVDPRLTIKDYQSLYQRPLKDLPPPLAAAVQSTSSPSTLLIVVRSRTVSHDAASHALVQELRALSLERLTVQVGGQTASEIDILQEVSQRFPFALAGIIGVTFIVLCLLFNSIILPLKAILMNILSIGASFGALVFIFQQGHLKELLNFTPLGYLDILLPLVLFCVVFGLSMDYEIFLLTRIKEAYDRCGDNSKSVTEGLEHTGWIITSAAGLMIIVTGAFTLTSIIFMKALGLGIALAVLIDATLIRVILVPAAMHLMGKWNWWTPRFLRLERSKST